MFYEARFKLTAYYLLIIMLISLFFSFIIYQLISREIERFATIQRFRIDRQPFTLYLPIDDINLVNDTKHRLLLTLLSINGGILILSGGLAYFLAGKTLEPIQDMLDEQNQFISDASHELRTPLTALKSSLEVSLRDKSLKLKDAKKNILENLEDVNRLQSLSDSLLDLAQYQKPQFQMKFETISFLEVFNRALKEIEPLLKSKNIQLKSDIQNSIMNLNQVRLCQLIVILLDNAIKYSPPKSVINVNSKFTDKYLEFSVKDQGIGIAKKDLPFIFDRFYRADSARSNVNTGGYGLGLSIAKKIIDHHQGSIKVVSQPENGSEFIIKLPLRPFSASFQY